MRKVFIVFGVIVSTLLIGLIIILSYLKINSDPIRDKLLFVVNEQLNTPVSAQNLYMDFVYKFPNISLNLNDVLINDTLKEDTLLFCKNLYIEFGILSVLKGETMIKKISAYEGKLNLKWNSKGENNYSILKPVLTNSNSYINLKGLTIMNTEINIQSQKSSSLDYHFIAKRIKLSGLLDNDAINAKARWEVYVPNWNSQSFFISGSSDFYSNSTSKNIEIKNGKLKLNEWQLQLSGTINENQGIWSASAKNLDMYKVIQLLPKEFIPSSKNLNLDGNLDLKIDAISNFSGTSINAKGNWTNGSIKINDSFFIGENINTQIFFSNGDLNSFESSLLRFEDISLESRESKFQGSLHLENFKKPRCRANVKFDSQWMDLMHWLEYRTWEGSTGRLLGEISWDNNFKNIDELQKKVFWGGKWKGNLLIPKANLEIKGANHTTELSNFNIEFDDYNLNIINGLIQSQNSKAKVKGTIKNVLNDLDETYELQIMGEEWHLEELRNWKIWEADFTGNDDSEFNSNYVLTISTDRVSFKSFMGTEARCVVIGKGYNAKTSDFFIRQSGGTISSIVEWRPFKDGAGQLRLNGLMKNTSLKEIFQSFQNFNQNEITDKNLSGKINATGEIRIDFNPEFSILSEKILADIEFKIKDGNLINFKTLDALRKFTEVEKLSNIKFGEFTNRVRIANKTIIIPQMTLENSALTLKVEGTNSFDGKMDFLIQMQLSELLGNKKTSRSKRLDNFIKEKNNQEKAWIPVRMKGYPENIKFSIDAKKISNDVKLNIKNDWKKQREDLKNLFNNNKKQETEYEFLWEEEEPDTNRLFTQINRSFNNFNNIINAS
tara:strand:- start:1955 stop:4459 length:2505 start_codon:yes stop_codon:yes gene_type:complete